MSGWLLGLSSKVQKDAIGFSCKALLALLALPVCRRQENFHRHIGASRRRRSGFTRERPSGRLKATQPAHFDGSFMCNRTDNPWPPTHKLFSFRHSSHHTALHWHIPLQAAPPNHNTAGTPWPPWVHHGSSAAPSLCAAMVWSSRVQPSSEPSSCD